MKKKYTRQPSFEEICTFLFQIVCLPNVTKGTLGTYMANMFSIYNIEFSPKLYQFLKVLVRGGY